MCHRRNSHLLRSNSGNAFDTHRTQHRDVHTDPYAHERWAKHATKGQSKHKAARRRRVIVRATKGERTGGWARNGARERRPAPRLLRPGEKPKTPSVVPAAAGGRDGGRALVLVRGKHRQDLPSTLYRGWSTAADGRIWLALSRPHSPTSPRRRPETVHPNSSHFYHPTPYYNADILFLLYL